MEAVRLRDAGEGAPKIRARLEHLALHTHGYMVPPDLYYLRARARNKGDRSVGLLSAALGSALDIKPVLHGQPRRDRAGGQDQGLRHRGGEAVRVRRAAGRAPALLTPDDVPELRRRTGRDARPARLRAPARCLRRNNVEVFESVMSLTGMVNVGKGAVVVGFAAEGQKFTG